MMWGVLFLLVIAAFIGGFIWMSVAIRRFHVVECFLPKARWRKQIVGILLMVVLVGAIGLFFDMTNTVIIFLHLLVFWLLCDACSALMKRFIHSESKHYYAGICAFLLTFIWLGIGWYNAHHVRVTVYDLTTEKDLGIGNLKIIGLSDSHVGATFHWEKFQDYIHEIAEQDPDLVVIMGDFVDDDTSMEDMENCCKALSELQPKYGIYYVYGNHDGGYFNNSMRGYTLQDLDEHLEAQGVRILRDETEKIAGNLYICGRLDASRDHDNRKDAATLMKEADLPEGAYVLTLDHEPNDYTAEAKSGMDLVISGHTHGGQFVGMGPLGVWLGANDSYYGYERREGTDFIVSSGISNWALKFKTGCISEYLIMNLKQNK